MYTDGAFGSPAGGGLWRISWVVWIRLFLDKLRDRRRRACFAWLHHPTSSSHYRAFSSSLVAGHISFGSRCRWSLRRKWFYRHLRETPDRDERLAQWYDTQTNYPEKLVYFLKTNTATCSDLVFYLTVYFPSIMSKKKETDLEKIQLPSLTGSVFWTSLCLFHNSCCTSSVRQKRFNLKNVLGKIEFKIK